MLLRRFSSAGGTSTAGGNLQSRVQLVTERLKAAAALSASTQAGSKKQTRKRINSIQVLPVMPDSTAYTIFCRSHSNQPIAELRRKFDSLLPEQLENYQKWSDREYQYAWRQVKSLLNKRSESVEVRWPYGRVFSVYVKHHLRAAVDEAIAGADDVSSLQLSSVRAKLIETFRALDAESKEKYEKLYEEEKVFIRPKIVKQSRPKHLQMPVTPYASFVREYCAQNELKGGVLEISPKLGKAWSECSAEQKKAYEEKYRDEMKQFAKRSLKLQAEIETDPELYLVELKDKLQRKIKKIPVDAAAALTDPEKKSGTNAYRNFVKANSLEIRKKSSSFAETSKQIAVKWGELTPEEKKNWANHV